MMGGHVWTVAILVDVGCLVCKHYILTPKNGYIYICMWHMGCCFDLKLWFRKSDLKNKRNLIGHENVLSRPVGSRGSGFSRQVFTVQ